MFFHIKKQHKTNNEKYQQTNQIGNSSNYDQIKNGPKLFFAIFLN